MKSAYRKLIASTTALPAGCRLVALTPDSPSVVIAGKDGFDYLIRDPGAGAAKGYYPLRELNSDIEALRFYQPLTAHIPQLSAQR